MVHKITTNSDFKTKKILGNESGMILLIASTFIMIICIVVIGLINRNVTQVLSTHERYKHSQAEQLARGAWWLVYDSLNKGTGLPDDPAPVTNDGTTYTITFMDDGVVSGRHQYRVQVSY